MCTQAKQRVNIALATSQLLKSKKNSHKNMYRAMTPCTYRINRHIHCSSKYMHWEKCT